MHDFFMVVLSLFYTGCIVDILMWIQKNVVQNLFYWEIQNNDNCKWNYIFMLLQYCNSITWQAVGQGDVQNAC